MSQSTSAFAAWHQRLVSYDYDESSTRYDGTSRLGTGFLLADWHPYATGFRLSGGLVYNNQRFAGTAQPSGGTINLNGMPYSSVGMLDGRLTFSRASPYLGVGWGLTPRAGSRLYFSADVGVMYQRPSAMLTGAAARLYLPACAHSCTPKRPNFAKVQTICACTR